MRHSQVNQVDPKSDGHLQMKNLEPNLIKSEGTIKTKSSQKRMSPERTKGPPPWRNHIPPKTMKVPTVTVIKRRKGRYFAQSKREPKNVDETISLPGLKDCINSRPPIKGDLQGPTVYSYDLPNDKPEMTSFPSYTIRPKTDPERDGGDRTAWGKEWFSHNYVWLQRADYDPRIKWPSPAHYSLPSAMGISRTPYHQPPAHTFGKRENFTLVRKGLEDEPAPNTYNVGKCKDRIMNKTSAFTIPQGRRRGTLLWPKRETVPGPGSYETPIESRSIKPRSAAFTFSASPRSLNLQKQCTL